MAETREPPAPPSREGAPEPPTLRLPGRDEAPVALDEAPTATGDAGDPATTGGAPSAQPSHLATRAGAPGAKPSDPTPTRRLAGVQPSDTAPTHRLAGERGANVLSASPRPPDGGEAPEMPLPDEPETTRGPPPEGPQTRRAPPPEGAETPRTPSAGGVETTGLSPLGKAAALAPTPTDPTLSVEPIRGDRGARAPDEIEERLLRMRAQRSAIAKDLVQIVAFVLTGIWVFSTFVWKERVQPRLAESSVTVRVTPTKVGERDGLLAVRLHAHVDNPSKSAVRVVAANYQIFGARVERDDDPPEPAPALSAIAGRAEWGYGSPGAVARDWQLVQNTGISYDQLRRDKAGPPLITVLPGSTFDLEFTVHVAKARWDMLRLHGSFVFLNAALADDVAPGWVELRREGDVTLHVPSEACNQEAGGRCPLFYASDQAELSLWGGPTATPADERPAPKRLESTAAPE